MCGPGVSNQWGNSSRITHISLRSQAGAYTGLSVINPAAVSSLMKEISKCHRVLESLFFKIDYL